MPSITEFSKQKPNLGKVFYPNGTTKTLWQNFAMLTCNGSFDTRKDSGEPYKTMTVGELWAMASEPFKAEKKHAPAIIPSSYCQHDGRNHNAQADKGQYVALTLDMDTGNLDGKTVLNAVQSFAGNGVAVLVYSSSSSTPEKRKWRAIVLLSEPLAFPDWQDLQTAFFEAVEEFTGVKPDHALKRAGQLVYLPNVPPSKRDENGEPLFYEHHAIEGAGLSFSPELVQLVRDARAAAEAEATAHAQAALARRKQAQISRAANGAGGVSAKDLRDAFNAENAIETLLAQYGYKQRVRTDHWRSRYQESGSYATRNYGTHWVSLSESDKAAGLGQPCLTGCFGDAFDLFVHFEHGGDSGKATYALGENQRAAQRNSLKATAFPTTKGTTFAPLDDFATATVATLDANEWDEIEPFSQVDAPEAFPVGALPERIQAAVGEVCAFVQAPVELTAVSALTTVSVAVQGLANVERANGLSGPCSIYALAIAESGERKSSVDNYFKAGLIEYEDRQREILAPVLREHLASLDAWKAQRDGILDAIRAASKKRENTRNLEQELKDHDKAKPEGPRIPRFCRSSDTPESLAFDLANEWPSAGVLSSEAGIVFGGHAMQADSATRNLAQLNQLWDGATLHFSRRTSQSFTVQNARVTMGLAIQEGPLREFFDKSKGLARSTGFLARFLVCWPESTIGTRKFKAAQSWGNLARFNGRISQLLEQIKIGEKGGVEPVMLCLTPEAQDVWIQYHDEVEAQLGPLGEFVNVKDVASKSADNAARLACVLHVFEHGLSAISADSMSGACVLALWFLGEAKRFFNHIDMPPETLRAKRLNDWLLERAKAEGMAQLSTREIRQFGPIRDGEQLTAAIELLTRMNRIKQVSIGKKRLIELNPELIGA